MTDIALAGDGVLDAQTVCHLVIAYVAEESVELDVLELLFAYHQVCNWNQNVLKLSLHCVFQLQTAAAFLKLNFLVVRQVDGNGLAAGIAVASIVDYIVYVQVALSARYLFFVLRVARQLFLQFGQHLGETSQVVAPLLVFYENKGFVGSLIAIECVFVVLDGAKHYVETAVLHIHPHHITLEIIVCTQCLASCFKVFAKAVVFGQFNGFVKQFVYSF